jgi:hypothetical protein
MRYLLYLYYVILFFSSFLALKNISRFNSEFKFFGFLVFLTLIVELLAFYFAISQHNNILVYIVFMPIRVVLINLAYYSYHKEARIRKISISLVLVYLAYYTNGLCEIKLNVFPNKLILFENIILYILVIYSSYLIISKQYYNSLKENEFLWVNIGYLFYFSVTFFVWSFHFVLKTNDINLISRITLIILNIMLYSIFTFSFSKVKLKSEN